jgi:uncharacterized protein YjiS (DUF1127 family)
MKYANAGHDKAPFAEFVDPIRFVGVVVYDTSETAARAVGRAFGTIVKRVMAQRTANEVSQLSDDALWDIGIDRADIGRLARRVAENPEVDYREPRGW